MLFVDKANQREYATPNNADYTAIIAFPTADGTAHRNPALPLPGNILQKAMTGKS